MPPSPCVALLWICYFAQISQATLSAIGIRVSHPSSSLFRVQLQWDQAIYSCTIRPNVTNVQCYDLTVNTSNVQMDADGTMTVTHIGSESAATLVIERVAVSGSEYWLWDTICSCLDDEYATQTDQQCSSGLNGWDGVCMSGSYGSTCGIYSWPTLSLSLDLESSEITVDTSSPAFAQHDCDDGFVDITNGNTEYWECGVNCPGGQYLTDGVCRCACIADSCNTETTSDGPEYYWLVGVGVFAFFCFLRYRFRKRRGGQQHAQNMAITHSENAERRTPKMPRVGEGGVVMCSESHPLVYSSKIALLDTSPGYKAGFICNLCGVHNKTEGAYHCRACKYDLCHQCYGIQKSPAVENPSHGLVSCLNHHPLAYTTPRGLLTTNSAYSNGFVCDHCNTTEKNTASYHCPECKYDLCERCYDAASNALDAPSAAMMAAAAGPVVVTPSAPPPGYEEQAPPPEYEPEALPSYQEADAPPPAYEGMGTEGAQPITNW